jgi:hypothetical protein
MGWCVEWGDLRRQYIDCDEAIENLRHSRTTNTEEAGERCPAFELAGVQK